MSKLINQGFSFMVSRGEFYNCAVGKLLFWGHLAPPPPTPSETNSQEPGENMNAIAPDSMLILIHIVLTREVLQSG